MFEHNPFKTRFLNSNLIKGSEIITAYRVGDFVDLCEGPHINNTSSIKSFKILKNSSSYWLGDAKNESLQRIYGISFTSKDQMKTHLKFLEEAEKNDH